MLTKKTLPKPEPVEPKRMLGRNPGGEHSSEGRMRKQVQPAKPASTIENWCLGTGEETPQ